MNFGKYALFTSVTHTFEKMPEWTWTFKPPSSADELAVAKFMKDGEPTMLELMWRELAYTFGGTTIPLDDEPVLSSDLIITAADHESGHHFVKVAKIERFLKEAPYEMVAELWSALGEAVPTMGPVKAPDTSDLQSGDGESSQEAQKAASSG